MNIGPEYRAMIRRFCWLFISVLFLVTAKAEDVQGTRYVMERTVNVVRVPIGGNTSEEVHSQVSHVWGILLASDPNGDWLGHMRFSLTGSEIGFTLWTSFPEKDEQAEGVTQILLRFIELRWLGISEEQAMAMALRPKPQEPKGDARRQALWEAAPWLPFEKLEKAKEGEVFSYWEVLVRDAYLFKDPSVTYVVNFSKKDDGYFCSLTALDGREFVAAQTPFFKEAAGIARQKVEIATDGYPRSSIEYWMAMRRALRDMKVEWKSPMEMNPTFGFR